MVHRLALQDYGPQELRLTEIILPRTKDSLPDKPEKNRIVILDNASQLKTNAQMAKAA